MWSPSQLNRTSSAHSAALAVGSIASSDSSQTATLSPNTKSSRPTREPIHQDERLKQQVQSPQQVRPWEVNLEEMFPSWNPKKRTLTLNSREHFQVANKQHDELHQSIEMKRQRSESVASVDTHTTLAEVEDPDHDLDVDLKTPTVARHRVPFEGSDFDIEKAGPMSQLLHSLLLKVADVERAQPTVMADTHNDLQARVIELERDNLVTLKAHNDLLKLRNDDLANLIKVRGLLAREKREHIAMCRLRDDDLENVLVLREKLAKATWSGKISRPTTPTDKRRSLFGGMMGSSSPQRGSRSPSDDLWQQAKTAAMEHRVMELEKANAELRVAQASSKAGLGIANGDHLVSRVENMFEDSLRHRERMATKVQQLRSEKEVLQKEVAGLEDRNGELEALVERLKRSATVGAGH